MPCRVGITMNPERRKKEWEKDYPNLRSWEIVEKCGSKSAAQARETAEAKRRNCDFGSGGSGPEFATWYVYYFWY